MTIAFLIGLMIISLMVIHSGSRKVDVIPYRPKNIS